MVKKLISVSIVTGAGILGACFGDGPTPSQPTKATVLFGGTPIQRCNTGSYIGPVAIGSDAGYVTMLPFVQDGGNSNGCQGGGPGTIPQTAEDVFSFDKGGGTLTKIGSAGMAGQGMHDQIIATPSGPVYAYGYTDMMGTVTYVEPGHVQLGSNGGGGAVIGLAVAGADIYALLGNQNPGGPSEPDNPEYPCCGGGGGVQGTIWKVGGGSGGVINPVCQTTSRCFVGNATHLIYFERPNTGGNELWRLTATPVGAGSAATITTDTNGGLGPVGLDADDTTVAYATGLTCPMTPCSVDECHVYAYDLASGQQKSLLNTMAWGCMDAKLADGYVYFTIVGFNQQTQHMFGKGIGRVSIADQTFESLDLHITGDSAGPRRIYPAGSQLFLVDPLVMARIDASALSGKHDFTP